MLHKFGLVPTNAKAVVPGDRFGRLLVIAVGQPPGTYRYKAVCQCDCGSPLRAVRFDSLIKGVAVACGCVQRERIITHGLTYSGHYHRWRNMMDRCYNPDCKSYPDYGGRGIAVCESWHDIATFVAELPPGYKSGLEIDRIDNDGHYQPGNVRWATRRKNTGNRRSARLLDFNGRTQSMTDWAAELGMSVGTLWTRIEKEGWSVERALTDPVISRVEAVARGRAARWGNHTKALKPPPRILKRVEYNGMSVTVAELSAMTGIPIAILRKRIFERGWSIDRAATTPI